MWSAKMKLFFCMHRENRHVMTLAIIRGLLDQLNSIRSVSGAHGRVRWSLGEPEGPGREGGVAITRSNLSGRLGGDPLCTPGIASFCAVIMGVGFERKLGVGLYSGTRISAILSCMRNESETAKLRKMFPIRESLWESGHKILQSGENPT